MKIVSCVSQVGLKIGVKTRGCNGLSYTLEYARDKGKFDAEVVQDGTLASPLICSNILLHQSIGGCDVLSLIRSVVRKVYFDLATTNPFSFVLALPYVL